MLLRAILEEKEAHRYLRKLGSQLRHHPLYEKVSQLHTLQTLLRRRYGIEHRTSGLAGARGIRRNAEEVGIRIDLGILDGEVARPLVPNWNLGWR